MRTAQTTAAKKPLDPALRRDLAFAVQEFNADYAETLDRGDIEAWPAFFTEDGIYRLIARDNADSSLPLSLMSCEGMGMLKDRAYAIAHTEMFAPRYVSHHISPVRVTDFDGEIISAQANYIILETLVDEPTRILQSGKYRDKFLMQGDRLLLKERNCIYDTVLVPTCVVYPP
ncbi:aromatic-ring-hydroxylating dioxygenase subunit beta [Microbacteriaceae bacterium K1510]|nr:aromatic-ring-hydroxylating dioxygenase subunit beta [Microbacteriaceae bacterium K1510]